LLPLVIYFIRVKAVFDTLTKKLVSVAT